MLQRGERGEQCTIVLAWVILGDDPDELAVFTGLECELPALTFFINQLEGVVQYPVTVEVEVVVWETVGCVNPVP